MMTNTNALRELLAAATPGPWAHDGDGEIDYYVPALHSGWMVTHPPKVADAALIVAAVNALPDLLDERDRMLATIARVEALADEWDVIGSNSIVASRVIGEHVDALCAALAGEGASAGIAASQPASATTSSASAPASDGQTFWHLGHVPGDLRHGEASRADVEARRFT